MAHPNYPSGQPALPTTRVNADAMLTTHPGDHNDIGLEVNAMGAELGLLPKGTFATVRARLDALGAILKAGTPVATEPGLNFIDGGGISTSVVDNPGSSRVDVTITSTGVQLVTNSQSGTTYTLILGDADKVIEFTSASAVTLTVPTNAVAAFPVGTVIELFRYGAGEVTVSGAGVTFHSPGGGMRLNSQYSAALLRKRATDEWILQGDIKV